MILCNTLLKNKALHEDHVQIRSIKLIIQNKILSIIKFDKLNLIDLLINKYLKIREMITINIISIAKKQEKNIF